MLSFLHADVSIQINVGPIESRPSYSNLFASANSPDAIEAAAAKFKIKVGEANTKRNPDLAETYQEKIATMNKVINDPKDPAKATANRQQLIDLLNEAGRRLSADSRSNQFLAGAEYSAAHYKETVVELTETCPNQDVINYKKLIENCPK